MSHDNCTGKDCRDEAHDVTADPVLEAVMAAARALAGDGFEEQLPVIDPDTGEVWAVVRRKNLGATCSFGCGWSAPASQLGDGKALRVLCQEHIKDCPKHPMRALEAALSLATKERDEARGEALGLKTQRAIAEEGLYTTIAQRDRAIDKIKRAVEEEREACALVAARDGDDVGHDPDQYGLGWRHCARRIERAIRSRGEEKAAPPRVTEADFQKLRDMEATLKQSRGEDAKLRQELGLDAPCDNCGGTGKVPASCSDPQCGDSTWDHECGLGDYEPCPRCSGGGK